MTVVTQFPIWGMSEAGDARLMFDEQSLAPIWGEAHEQTFCPDRLIRSLTFDW